MGLVEKMKIKQSTSGELLLVYTKQRYTPCRNEQRRNPVAIAPYFISMVPKPGFEPGQAYAH
jgi:hypothetical protein